jgi:hypothetical protein
MGMNGSPNRISVVKLSSTIYNHTMLIKIWYLKVSMY